MNKYLKKHIEENYKSYFIFIIVFVLGMIIGIIALNNLNEEQKNSVSTYITNFIETSKNSNIDYTALLKNTISKNFKFVLVTIIIDLSVFRLIASNLMIGYKGFCLGYSISSIIAVIGIQRDLRFNLSFIFLSEIFYIPAIFYLNVSSLNLYKNLRDGNYDSKKFEIIRYCIKVGISSVMMILSSLVETYINTNLFLSFLKFF